MMKVILAIVLLTILYIFGMSKLEVMRLSDLIMLSSSSTVIKSSSSSSTAKESSSSVIQKINVSFSGAVNKTGTHAITPFIYYKDALDIAGGLSHEADLDAIDLEYVITAEDTSFYIPAKSSIAKISINTASIEELELLPSIGVVTATNIVNYRTKNGGFKTIDELLKVDRIGVKTFESIRDLIKL